jgi:hypothetical protein
VLRLHGLPYSTQGVEPSPRQALQEGQDGAGGVILARQQDELLGRERKHCPEEGLLKGSIVVAHLTKK